MKNEELFKIADNTFAKCLDTLRKKNHDYSTGENLESDALKNFKLVNYLAITDAPTGVLVRLCDKFSRLANIYRGGAQVTDESIEDTIDDAINYLIILKATISEND